jgi:hypothetical protein
MVLYHTTGRESVMAYEVNDRQQKMRRSRRSVVLQRSYKDGDDRKQINSFGLSDLPTAIRVLQFRTYRT